MTSKNRFLNILLIYYKLKTEITHLHKSSDPLLSTLLKHFSGLSRDVRSGSSPGPGWGLGSVLRVVVLFEREPSLQSEVLRTLEQVFIKDLSVLCAVQLTLDPGLVSQSLPMKNIPRA
jgi:hypothetical protein